MRILILILGGLAYWTLACVQTGTTEPWDADTYWTVWYPGSLALSILGGILLRKRGWAAGAVISFAQLPVIWMNAEPDPLWVAGLLVIGLLALPAVGASALSGWWTARSRRT